MVKSGNAVTLSISVKGRPFTNRKLSTTAQMKVGRTWLKIGHATGDRAGKVKVKLAFPRQYRGKKETLRAVAALKGYKTGVSSTLKVRVK